jgi:hypothetical protein
MSVSPVARRGAFGVAGLFMLYLAWNGLVGGVGQWHGATTLGQRVQTCVQICYGVFAVLAIATIFRGRRWARLALIGLALTATVAGGLAAVSWGSASLAMGLLTSAVALLVMAGAIWLLRFGARGITGS